MSPLICLCSHNPTEMALQDVVTGLGTPSVIPELDIKPLTSSNEIARSKTGYFDVIVSTLE